MKHNIYLGIMQWTYIFSFQFVVLVRKSCIIIYCYRQVNFFEDKFLPWFSHHILLVETTPKINFLLLSQSHIFCPPWKLFKGTSFNALYLIIKSCQLSKVTHFNLTQNKANEKRGINYSNLVKGKLRKFELLPLTFQENNILRHPKMEQTD